jgi:hypothetical protein
MPAMRQAKAPFSEKRRISATTLYRIPNFLFGEIGSHKREV